MPHAPRLLALVVLLTLAGCRTYGSYGNEEATAVQIAEANRVFAADLERARGDLLALEQAAETTPALRALYQRYYATVTLHEALLNEHVDLASELDDDEDDYRVLSRLYGAIITENRIVRQRYFDLLVDIDRSLEPAATIPGGVLPEGRYYVAPPFYARLGGYDQLPSVSSLLGGDAGVLRAVPAVVSGRLTEDAVTTAPGAEETALGADADGDAVVD